MYTIHILYVNHTTMNFYVFDCVMIFYITIVTLSRLLAFVPEMADAENTQNDV